MDRSISTLSVSTLIPSAHRVTANSLLPRVRLSVRAQVTWWTGWGQRRLLLLLLLRVLADGVDHVDRPDDDPDQGHQHDGGQARGALEHDRGHEQGDQHGPEGEHDGLPTGAVGPLGPDHAPFG